MTHSKRRNEAPFTVGVIALVLLSSFSLAQNGDLYGPQAPAQAAWLRVLNGTAAELPVTVADKAVTLGFGEASDYLLAEPGSTTVSLGSELIEVTTAAGQFLTLAKLPGQTLLLTDPVLRDVSRGLLALLNLTDQPELSLLTPEGDTVVSGVAPGEAAALPISPATTSLNVFAADTLLGSTVEQEFERGAAYTVVALHGPEGTVLVLLEAGTD